jgi:hypothetical protein
MNRLRRGNSNSLGLIDAAQNGDVARVKAKLRAGKDVNSKDEVRRAAGSAQARQCSAAQRALRRFCARLLQALRWRALQSAALTRAGVCVAVAITVGTDAAAVGRVSGPPGGCASAGRRRRSAVGD